MPHQRPGPNIFSHLRLGLPLLIARGELAATNLLRGALPGVSLRLVPGCRGQPGYALFLRYADFFARGVPAEFEGDLDR